MTTPSIRAVELHGRLGNQLFQYALVRAMEPPDRPVLVEAFAAPDVHLQESLRPGAFRRLTAAESLRLRRLPSPPTSWRRLASGAVRRLPDVATRALETHVVQEATNHQVDPAVLAATGDVLFRGFFQNEGYFRHASELVLDGLAPPTAAAVDATEHARRWAAGRPLVVVVVRAGLDAERLGWTVPFSWYDAAVRAVEQEVGDVAAVVCSDVKLAAEAVAAALAADRPAIARTDLAPADGLWLIAAGDHVVTSATSFGWWGAWIGDARDGFPADRVVVAPEVWCEPGWQPAPDRWRRVPVPGDRAA